MKQYLCDLERHNIFNCYFSTYLNGADPDLGRIRFFNKNNFAVLYNMYDPNWSNEVQIEEIFKKLILLYNFNPNSQNILIERGEKKIYLPNKKFVYIGEGDVFVYDVYKIKIAVEEKLDETILEAKKYL